MTLLSVLLCLNCTYLSNTSVTPNRSIWGNDKQIATLKQNYYERIRNYNELDNSFQNQQSYYQTFSGHSQSYQDLYITFKKTQTQDYINNVRKAQKNGEVDPTISYGGAVVSSLSGNPTKTSFFGLDLSQNVNIINGTSETVLNKNKTTLNFTINSKSPRDADTAWVNNTEFYKGQLSCPVGLGFDGTETYGGTTNTSRASLTHTIYKNLAGSVSKTWSMTTLVPVEIIGSLGYGVNF